ncbi:MAG TPA: alpha/beta hydrolase [Longimicrobiales bacterium]|nr:alpha/beta hydrolase [Longimicrobiales bacterium]
MCFLLALLAVLPAPTYRLWQVAVLVTEAGAFLAVAALLVLLPGWRATRAGVIGASLGVCAALLAVSPWARAVFAARDAHRQLAPPSGDVVSAPWRISGTLSGNAGSSDALETHAYAQRGDRALMLDLYRPAAPVSAARPLVVVIHGGSWRGGDQRQLPKLNRHLSENGYIVAAIQYRLAPAHTFPAALEDVTTAVTWLRAHAVAFDIDTTRIALLGRSAGGQLALLAAYTMGSNAVHAAISYYGPTDLRWGWEHPSNPRVIDSRAVLRDYIGGTLAERADVFDRASPLRFAETAVPTLLLHGGRDELVSEQHAIRLSSALEARGTRHAYVRLTWATHGCDFVFRGPCGRISTWAVERFLDGVFGGGTRQLTAESDARF